MPLLYGWGRTAPSAAAVMARGARDHDGLATLIATATGRGAIARGLGRSYGDSAQNGGGLVIRLDDETAQHANGGRDGQDRRDRPVVIDRAAGTVTASAGVSLDAVLRASVPAGLFVPVSPGTRFVTVGGAIASDIHGKNHHVDGTFGRHVTAITMMLADGSVVELGPAQRPELFWATIGGMGLTGLILEATFRMLPIETSRCSVDTERVADLDALLALMEHGDDAYRYSVAWIDLMAKGASLGRSVLTRGDHARVEELTPKQAVYPLDYRASQFGSVPPIVPRPGLLNHLSVGAFNEAWFRKARRRVGQIVSIPSFFHPLDAVGHWNRLYGRRGFLQYQFVVPFGQEVTLRHVIERLSDSGTTSFLAVLKRFGAANDAPLSFPRPGWTLALDIPGGAHGLIELLAELDEVILDAGGRHYLAKDSTTTPDSIRRGYPRLAEWQRTRDRYDPDHRWASDQSRRLHLTDPTPTEPIP